MNTARLQAKVLADSIDVLLYLGVTKHEQFSPIMSVFAKMMIYNLFVSCILCGFSLLFGVLICSTTQKHVFYGVVHSTRVSDKFTSLRTM